MADKRRIFRESKDDSSKRSERNIKLRVIIYLFIEKKPWDSKQHIIMVATVEMAELIHGLCMF